MNQGYVILYKDYKSNIFKAISHTLSFNEAVVNCEKIALNFITQREGDQYGEKFYEKSKSGKWGRVPFGYFVCRGSNKTKFTIYRKYYQCGYIYSSVKIDKVCSFEYAKLETEINSIPESEIIDKEAVVENFVKKHNLFKVIHKTISSLGKADGSIILRPASEASKPKITPDKGEQDVEGDFAAVEK